VRNGARVAVLDIDAQGSLATWARLRRQRLGPRAVGFEFAALPGWRAEEWIVKRAREADVVIIDSPPNVETEARIAIRSAGLVLIPVQPSPLDL
jgi:chromosome partitioning protein